MNDLLALAIDAHPGMERWGRISRLWGDNFTCRALTEIVHKR